MPPPPHGRAEADTLKLLPIVLAGLLTAAALPALAAADRHEPPPYDCSELFQEIWSGNRPDPARLDPGFAVRDCLDQSCMDIYGVSCREFLCAQLNALPQVDKRPPFECDPCRDLPALFDYVLRTRLLPVVTDVLGTLNPPPNPVTPVLQRVLVRAAFYCDPSGGTGSGSSCGEVATATVVPGTSVRVGARAINTLTPTASPATTVDDLTHCAWVSVVANGSPVAYVHEYGRVRADGSPSCLVQEWAVVRVYPSLVNQAPYVRQDC